MGLFPQHFLDDLRMQADIVRVVMDKVPLKRSGSSYKGLCPFHGEKTPSFNVNPSRGIFHCFGCGVGGDVFKFVELYEKVSFPEAVRLLAARVGVSVPETDEGRDPAADAERETLLKIHELAAAYFREQLGGSGGARARRLLEERGFTRDTVETLGLGFAGPARDGLRSYLRSKGFDGAILVKSGLVVEREGGQIVDRFRNRLVIPICRESGPVVAFGGRAMEAGQQPKYLNSPETAIYSKGRTLYGLHLTKAAIRRLGYAVLVEGYFDLAQAYQAGVQPLVASCGTALTPAQARSLRRLAGKVVLSYDPDAAGQSAAERSSELLVTEGFQVNVAMLPAGQDPDTFIRTFGRDAYVEKLRTSRPYLEYLLDRAAQEHDLGNESGRRAFLGRMLGVAARIPDAAVRDQFADRLAHKARITEDVVRGEIRKAAAQRRTDWTPPGLAAAGEMKPAETGLLWALTHEPEAAAEALAGLEAQDLEGLRTAPILLAAQGLAAGAPEHLPRTLAERLNQEEAELVSEIGQAPTRPAPADACVQALKRLRYERERAAVQREIDRLQESGQGGDDARIDALWLQKKDLSQRIEALGLGV
jgi:DNA primase